METTFLHYLVLVVKDVLDLCLVKQQSNHLDYWLLKKNSWCLHMYIGIEGVVLLCCTFDHNNRG